MQVGRSLLDPDLAGLPNAILTEIENVCGARPPSCPWSAYRSDIVAEVQYRASIKEINPNEALNPSVPYLVYNALLFYESAVNKAKNHFRELEREEREKERNLNHNG